MEVKKTVEQKTREDLPPAIEPGKVGHLAITELYLKDADTEYEYQLPKGCNRFKIQVRDNREIRIATERGVVATPETGYWSLRDNANDKWEEDNLDIRDENFLIYFATPHGGKYVQIIVGF